MKRAILYTIFCLFLLACAAWFILDKGSAKQLSSDKLLITFTSQELKVTYINFLRGKIMLYIPKVRRTTQLLP